MAEHNLLYQMATYYDIALNRDVKPEVDFIQEVFQQIANRPLTSVLEVACGPAYHSRELSRRGISAIGLDLRPEMIDFAKNQARQDGVEVDFLVADMCRFKLDKPVDMVIAVFDALDALVSNQALIDHFRCVGDSLASGGLYLIDLTHPRDVSFTSYGDFCYAGSRDGIDVEIRWATEKPVLNLVEGTYRTELTVSINENGQTHLIKDSASERLLFPQEIQLLTMIAGSLRVVGWYGDYGCEKFLDMSPASRRMIAILQKEDSGHAG